MVSDGSDTLGRRAAVQLFASLLLLAAATRLAAVPQALPDEAHLQRVRDYIKQSWTTLTRSNRYLPRALPDPKMPRPPGAKTSAGSNSGEAS